MGQKDSSGMWKVESGVNDICTTSGLRAWWLSAFRGYRINSIVQMPHRGSFGRIKYYRRWVLVPRDKVTK